LSASHKSHHFFLARAKAIVQLSRLKFFQQLRLAALLLVQFIVAGCATRKAPEAHPLPTYPAVPESAIQEVRQLPSGAYDKLEVITIEAEVGMQLLSAMESVRQSAAQKGANAIVVLNDTEFSRSVDKRKVRIRRIVYLAIHRR
jgi:hypothetical protein